jgi:hypothetical protein
MALGKKFSNFTEVKVEAKMIDSDGVVEDLGLGPDDIILAELPKKDDWTFAEASAEVQEIELK